MMGWAWCKDCATEAPIVTTVALALPAVRRLVAALKVAQTRAHGRTMGNAMTGSMAQITPFADAAPIVPTAGSARRVMTMTTLTIRAPALMLVTATTVTTGMVTRAVSSRASMDATARRARAQSAMTAMTQGTV